MRNSGKFHSGHPVLALAAQPPTHGLNDSYGDALLRAAEEAERSQLLDYPLNFSVDSGRSRPSKVTQARYADRAAGMNAQPVMPLFSR